MKSLLSLILFLTFFSTVIAQEKGSWYCSQRHEHSRNSYQSLPFGPNTPLHSYDVLKYTLDLDLSDCYTSPFSKYFEGSNIISFRVDSVLNSIQLNAVNSSLEIDSVKMAAVTFTHVNNILTLTLDREYQPGEVADVKIYYHHKNVTDQAFYASNGFVFTDCEPTGARKWFPCWDWPNDKAATDITVKVPSNVKLGSNGRLQDSTNTGTHIFYHWVSDHPVATYLTVLTSKANYNLDIVYWTKPSTSEQIPMRFYYNAGENPTAMKNIIVPLTDFFSEKFGEHPFDKNGFATLNNQFSWGGMENQTLTSLCPGCWYEDLIVHEFAHQWFGDMITCGTWADLWLNEGFATYLETLWHEELYGYESYKSDIESNASYYMNSNPGWALSDPTWAFNPPDNGTLFNYAVTYMKASCILHLLRYIVGDEIFFEALHAYAMDEENFKHKTVVTQDFSNIMSEVYGQDLSWFFQDWIYQPNHPAYQNTYSFTEMQSGNWLLYFNVHQVQQTPSFFRMPVEIRVLLENGNDTIIRVMNEVNHQSFSFIFESKPLLVQFDPFNNIIMKTASTVVGVDEAIKTGPELILYSIPTGSELSFAYQVNNYSKVRIDILDMNGRLIRNLLFSSETAGLHQLSYDISDIPNGMYVLRLTDQNQVKSVKLIKN